MSTGEVAAVLGTTESTVRNHILPGPPPPQGRAGLPIPGIRAEKETALDGPAPILRRSMVDGRSGRLPFRSSPEKERGVRMDGDRIDGGCGRCEALLPAWSRERLDEDKRQRLRRHLAGCAACRDEAALLDPSVLFLTLEGRHASNRTLAGFDAALRARIAADAATIERAAGRMDRAPPGAGAWPTSRFPPPCSWWSPARSS